MMSSWSSFRGGGGWGFGGGGCMCKFLWVKEMSLPGGSLQVMRETLAESSPLLSDVDKEDIDLGERNIKQCKRKICDGHYTTAVRVLSPFGVAPYNDATLKDLKTKHPFKPPPSLPQISIDHHHLVASPAVVLDIIKSFPRGTSCGRDGLHAQHLMDCLSGVAVAISNKLVSSITQVVNLFLDGKCPQQVGRVYCQCSPHTVGKPSGGIRPIVVGIVWRRLISKVSAIMIGHSLDGYLDGLQFGVGVAGGSEAILHSVNRLIEACGDDVGLSMLLVDFKNAFNLVDREVMLREVRLRCPAISRWVEFCYFNPAKLHYGEHTLWSCQGVQQDTVVVGKVLELIMKDGPGCGLHLNVDKTEVFWPKEDPRSRLACIFPPNIARPLYGVKLLGGPASVDYDFCNELVMKRVAKTIGLMDAIAKINDPQCELLLLRSYTESPFSLSPRLMTLWTSQREDHTSDWLRTVPISGLGQTMNDHAVSCAGIIGIKHRHNVVRDTLVDICYRSGISAGKDVDIGLDGGRDKPLRPPDMLLYSWDGGLDVCIGYVILPFSFSSLGELEADAVTLLKRIRKFSMAHDIGARVAVHIFNRISFAIAKGVEAQIVSRLPSNLL
ncbi:hypothetical protein Tco_0635499 [Tanacetum coccineum]